MRVRVRVRVGPIAAAAGVFPLVLADCRWQAAAGRLGLPLSAGRAAALRDLRARGPRRRPFCRGRHVNFCGHTRLLYLVFMRHRRENFCRLVFMRHRREYGDTLKLVIYTEP